MNTLNYTVPNAITTLPNTQSKNSGRRIPPDTLAGTEANCDKLTQDYVDAESHGRIRVQQQAIVKEDDEGNETSSFHRSQARTAGSNAAVNTCSKIRLQEELTLNSSEVKKLAKYDLQVNSKNRN